MIEPSRVNKAFMPWVFLLYDRIFDGDNKNQTRLEGLEAQMLLLYDRMTNTDNKIETRLEGLEGNANHQLKQLAASVTRKLAADEHTNQRHVRDQNKLLSSTKAIEKELDRVRKELESAADKVTDMETSAKKLRKELQDGNTEIQKQLKGLTEDFDAVLLDVEKRQGDEKLRVNEMAEGLHEVQIQQTKAHHRMKAAMKQSCFDQIRTFQQHFVEDIELLRDLSTTAIRGMDELRAQMQDKEEDEIHAVEIREEAATRENQRLFETLTERLLQINQDAYVDMENDIGTRLQEDLSRQMHELTCICKSGLIANSRTCSANH